MVKKLEQLLLENKGNIRLYYENGVSNSTLIAGSELALASYAEEFDEENNEITFKDGSRCHVYVANPVYTIADFIELNDSDSFVINDKIVDSDYILNNVIFNAKSAFVVDYTLLVVDGVSVTCL